MTTALDLVDEHVASDRLRRVDDRSPLRRAVSALFTFAVLGVAAYLWPATLGGVTRLVIVTGDSMSPTYHYGDVVVTRDRGEPVVGDAVVFEVPDGPAEGLLVIHRVLTIDTSGTITTQGDNRDTPDQWPLERDDVVGEPVAHIPKAGLIVWTLQSPFAMACIGLLAAALILWPRERVDDDDEIEEIDPGDDVLEPSPVMPLVDHEMWRLEPPPAIISSASLLVAGNDELRRRRRRIGERPTPIVEVFPASLFDLGAPADPDLVAEAEAWLDEQLAGV